MKVKICSKCKQEKPLDEFHKNKNTKDGLAGDCKECRKSWHIKHYEPHPRLGPKFDKAEWQRNWRKDNPEKYRKNAHKSRLKTLYGITVEDWHQMFEEQQGCCAICSIPQNMLKQTLCVDHNHKTGKIRQLVCDRCNMLIGIYEANFDGFEYKIKDYLEKNNG